MQYFNIKGTKRIRLGGLRGSSGIFDLVHKHDRAIIVASEASHIPSLAAEVLAYNPEARVLEMPPLDGTPFSFTPVHASTRRARLQAFAALFAGQWDYLVLCAHNLLECQPPPQKLLSPMLKLSAGEDYDLSQLCDDLVQMGYYASDMVMQPGDFARRGGILDIYSFEDEVAYRLDFFDDELEEIRIFDPSNQRGIGTIDDITIMPLYEWVIGDEEKDAFFLRGGELWNQSDARDRFLELVAQVRDRGRFTGFQHWTGLFHGSPFHLQDFLPQDSIYYFHDWDAILEHQEKLLTQLALQEEAITGGKQLSATRRILFGQEDPTTVTFHEDAVAYSMHTLKIEGVDQDHLTQSVPHYNNDAPRMIDHWKPHGERMAVVLMCKTAGTLKRFEEFLDDAHIKVSRLNFPIKDSLKPGFYLALGQISSGFSWPDRKLVVIGESDVFVGRSGGTKRKRPAVSAKKLFQSEFRDLKTGDLVVHLDHGIGKFLGLVEMQAGGATHEMMALEYKGGQKLYVNLNQLDLVQRYGSDQAGASLDKLGGVSWERTKKRIKKAVREMAGELIKLYAQRQVTESRPYGADTEWQMEFEEAFEHEPTSGQLAAVSDLKSDLESTRPMDRLLVGDVGFGKTEVAMRMAFKAVMEGYQVAVLCPTTVLAFQHYHTFKNRFASFPVTIRWVSRFSGTKETKKTLEEVTTGACDILIGTHRILSKDMQFKNLGALIIDEEQRFGVSHKERLKQMRKKLDVLSMSATPIPRTLNMSMSGIRDISVIETPPRNRLAINTSIAEAREGLIKNAIEFEMDRNGQAYFIHNRVESIDTVAATIKSLVPRAVVGVAHGQMDAAKIEKVMLAFMNHEIDVLVASTIIENGVDVPNANTMLVNRSDMFGMSQLYQLRGRIGRGDRPAYAYLLVPPKARMTAIARKRLAALEEFSDLGSGFRIAAMDMELRGAGNLVGAEQAGHINAIGYETYIKLLQEAVDEMKGAKIEDRINTLLKLNLGAAIPRNYIEETNQRLSYYKRLAAANKGEEIEEIRETLRDMFGPIPTPCEQLCKEHELRIALSKEGLLSVEREKDVVKFRFHGEAELNHETVFAWMTQREDVKVEPDGVIRITLASRKAEDVLAQIPREVASLRS